MMPIAVFSKVRITSEPRVNTFKGRNGEDITQIYFGCVANEAYKKKGATEYTDVAHFYNFEARSYKAEFIRKYGGKGSLVDIQATVTNQRWEKDGQKFSKILFKVIDVVFLEKIGAGAAPKGKAPADPDFEPPSFDDDQAF